MFDFVAAFHYRASVHLRLTRVGLAALQYDRLMARSRPRLIHSGYRA